MAETGGAGTLTYSYTGSLPAGLSLNGSTGAVTGTPTGPVGTTNFTVKVTDSSAAGAQSATQALSITINQAPAITSAASVTFVVGTAGTFAVTATGTPTPSLTETGGLPSGVTFVDNGNGTATLSGTPASGTAANYPITITANNGVGTAATQNFTLTVGQTPAITSANSTTLTVGTAGTFTVTTTGFPAPSLSETGAVPSGVTFVDNGDGTAKLSGTPASGTGGTYSISIKAHNGIGTDATQTFTLTVDQTPAITSANSTTFTVNTLGTFSVTATGFPTPSINESGALPTGVTFVDNGNGTGTLAGTPTTIGNYSITFTPSNGVGSPAAQTFTLTVGQAPAITSANSTTFTVGAAGTLTVTTTGFPKPSLSDGGATLPSGVTFVDNGDGTATLGGTPGAGTGGTYSFTMTASNGVGSNATQSFTLTVNTAPVITSANSTTFTVGTPGSFTVTTTGTPTPTLSKSATLPTGVTFVDNGDGTATLSGTPGAGTGGTYAITITASNGVGSNGTQNFTLTVDQAPAITTTNSTTFTEGVASSFSVLTTGFPKPGLTETGPLPSGVAFSDNGDGTATLSGTPGSGTAGSYPFVITANNSVGTPATQDFTLTVNTAPVFTSATSTTFTAGTAGSFTVTTTGSPTPTLTYTGSLPSGVNFTDNGNGTGTLSGTPSAGTGGSYPITIKAQSTSGNTTQSFTLAVNEAPAITSSDKATFTVGEAGNFTVNTSGNPQPSLSETGALPSGVSFTDNGDGTATLSGTPASGTANTYNIVITANNGIGTPALQTFTLTVISDPCLSAGTGGESLLSGNYAFVLKGFDNGLGSGETSSEPALVGGVLTFNGSGSITAGKVDMNLNSTAGVRSNSVTSGSYKIGASGTAEAQHVCMTITTVAGTQHYRASLNSAGSTGHMIDFDSSGPFTAGVLRKQSTTIPTTLSGNFAFGVSSIQNTANSGGGKSGIAGVIDLSTSSVTGGVLDLNEEGVLDKNPSCTDYSLCGPFSINSGGSYSIQANGRGTLTFSVTVSGTPKTVNEVIYVVSPSEVLILSSDDQTGNVAFAGTALLQSGGPFSNSSMKGTSVLYLSNPNGSISSHSGTNTNIGTAVTNGSGSVTVYIWQNDGGSIACGPGTAPNCSITANYSVASSGRVTITNAGNHPPLLYIVSANKAFMLGGSGGVETGMFEPQTSTSVSGTVAFGTTDPESPDGGVNEGLVTFSSGNVSGTNDQNSSGSGPQASQTIPSTSFSVDSTGLGEVPANCLSTSSCEVIFYVISPSRAVIMDASSGSQNPSIQIADK
jgi:hypothetical protein